MAEQNKSGGFINLKKIHDIQVSGAVQALIRDLRSTRIQLEHVLSEALKLKHKNSLEQKEEPKPQVEVEPKVEQAAPKQEFVADQKRQFNASQTGREFNKDKNFKKQAPQKQFSKPFGQKEGQKEPQRGAGFASSKGNNFRSFAAPDIVIQENTRNFGNKNKSSSRDLDEKRQPTSRRNTQNYKNVFVNNSDGF